MLRIYPKIVIENALKTGAEVNRTELEGILESLEDYERLYNLCINSFDSKGKINKEDFELLKTEVGVISPFPEE